MDDLKLDGLTDAPPTDDLKLDLGQSNADAHLHLGIDSNPDQAAKNRVLSQQSGLPVPIVEGDPKSVEQDVKLQKAKDTVAGSPELQLFLGDDPENAKVVHDDLDPLAKLGKAYSQMTPAASYGFDVGQRFAEGIKSSIVNQEIGRQGSKLAVQRDIGEDTTGTQSKINDLQLEAKHFPENPGILSATGLGSVVGGLVDSINHSLPIFLGATVAGGVAGAGAAGVGAIPGAGAGAVYGLIHGMAADQAKIIAGHSYLALDAARDSNGQPLPELAKQGGAVVAGVGGYIFNSLGGWHIEGFARDALTKQFSETVADQVVKNPSVAQSLGTAVKAIGESGATGGGVMAGQTVTASLSEALAKVYGGYSTGGTFENLFNNKDELIKASQQGIAAFIDGASLMALTRMPAAGANMVSDIARVGAAKQAKAQFDAAFQAAQETATRERAPDILKNYLEGINGQKIYIPAEVIGKLYNATPDGVGHLMAPGSGPFGFVKDLHEQYQAAREHGGDIEIGLADYFTHMDPEVHGQVSDHIRQDRQGLSMAEAIELEKNPPQYLKQSVEETHPVEGYHGSSDVMTELDPNKTHLGRGLFVSKEPNLASEFALGKHVDSDPFTLVEDHDFQEKMHSVLPDADKPTFDEKLAKEREYSQKSVDGILTDEEDAHWGQIVTELHDQARQYNNMISIDGVAHAANVSKVRVNPGKSLQWDMGGKFDWDGEKAAIEKARAEGYDSVEFTNTGVGDYYSILNKDNVVPYWITRPEAGRVLPKTDSATGLVIHQAITSQIDAERKTMWLDPMFETPKAAGMSKTQFKLYSDHLQEVQRNITQGVYTAVEKEIARRETKLWKDAVNTATDAARDDFGKEPVHFADWNLRTGKAPNGEKLDTAVRIKLDPNAVDVMYGGVDARSGMNDAWFSQKGGAHPDDVADLYGFNSGREMMDALAALETERRATGETPTKHFDRLVKEEAGRRVETEHGKLDERILKEALEAALDVKQIDVLIDEMSRLAKDAPISKEAVLKSVQDSHDMMSVDQARDHKAFEYQAGKYGRAAEMALLKGDFAGAFKFKQQQLMNFMLAREAKSFDKTMNGLEGSLDRYGKNASLNAVDQSFTDQIHLLMRAVDEKIPRSDENLEQAVGKKTLGDFVHEQALKDQILAVPDWLQKDIPVSLKDMNASQARALKMAIDSLDYVGRQEKLVEVAGKKQLLDTVTGDIKSNIELAFPGENIDWEKTGKKGIVDDLKALARRADSALLKVEQMAQWFDRRDPNGPFNTYVIRPLKEAQFWRDDKVVSTGGKLRALYSKEVAGRINELVPNATLMDRNGQPQKLTRGNVMMLALNMGSESNMEVLTKGRNWDPNAVHDLVSQTLSPEEIKFVNGVHKIFESLWPDVQRVTKEMSGVAVERVPAKSTPLVNGQLTGGYFPLMRDMPLSQAMGKGEKTDGYFDQRTFNPFADATALHERTGATYPLDLTFEQLPWKLRELIHGVAYRVPIRDVAKIIEHKDVFASVADNMGEEYASQLVPWLHYIARDGSTKDLRAGWDEFGRWVSEGRANAVAATLGFRGISAVVHGTSALLNSIGETGPLEFSKASGKLMGEMMLGKFDTWNAMHEESGELRHRAHNLDRDLGAQMDAAMGETSFRRQMMLISTWLISTGDKLSTVPTYMAAKEINLKKGMSEADAIYAAEQTLRNAHGSAGAMDLPTVMRSDGMMKAATMFYSYFNHNYNRERDMGRLVSDKQYGSAVGRFAMYVIFPAMIHAALYEPKGEDEGTGHWIANAMASHLAGGLPLGRDIMYAIQHGRAGGSGILGGLIQSAGQVATDAKHAWADDGEPPKWIEHFGNLVAFGTGIGSKSTSRLAQSAYNVSNGTLDPSEMDAWSMFLTGAPHRNGK